MQYKLLGGKHDFMIKPSNVEPLLHDDNEALCLRSEPDEKKKLLSYNPSY